MNQVLPTIEEAEKMLHESYKMNPGPWADHSRVVADCSRRVALNSCNIDPDKAYICGLLHDIGRRFGVSYFRHVFDGYHYMIELGYDDVAKICLTHSFPVKDIHTYIGKYDVSDDVVKETAKKLTMIDYDDYDRLIQLCDCLAMPEGAVNMSVRMEDIARRHGHYPEEIRKANFELKDYFENKMGRNLYQVVSDNKELWGK